MARRGLCFRPSKQISELETIGKHRTCRRDDNPATIKRESQAAISYHSRTIISPAVAVERTTFQVTRHVPPPRFRLFPWTENLSDYL
jgi:hypothetical protein